MFDRQSCAIRLHSADTVLFVGETVARPRRMPSQIVVVFHRRDGWTHLYRTDDRDERTVHLVRAVPGDETSALAAWARQSFDLTEETLAMAA